MSKEAELISSLEQIKAIVDAALSGARSDVSRKTVRQATVVARTTKEGLPAQILALRDKGFFKQPKTAPEVHEALQSQYSCALNRVEVALMRIKKTELRKTTKLVGERKKKAYTW